MRHAGVERLGRSNLTACGIIVPARRAPYAQSVGDISCRRCRRSVIAAIEKVRKEMLYGLTHNANYLKELAS